MTAVLDVDRVLVPIDGSSLSQRAARPAAAIARAVGVPVQLVTVTSPGMETLDDRLWMEAITEALPGLTAPPLVLLSNDVPRALDDVLRMEPSMLCMATHGRTGLAGLVAGSNAKDVVEGATGLVVLVGPEVGDVATLDAVGVLVGDHPAAREIARAIAEGADARVHAVSGDDADPVRSIVDGARDAHLDLLVTSMHGRALQQVVRRVPCPVLVIPPPGAGGRS